MFGIEAILVLTLIRIILPVGLIFLLSYWVKPREIHLRVRILSCRDGATLKRGDVPAVLLRNVLFVFSA